MHAIKTLFKKELAFYLNTPVGYIVATLFAVFANFLFVKDLFVRGDTSMRPFFDMLPWLLIVFVPAIAMRTFSEEKRTNTIEVLLTLPASKLHIVVGKWLALCGFCAIALFLTFSLPVALSLMGGVALGEVFVAYVGIFFLASSFAALSLFFSLLTKNQMIAFLASIGALFLFYVFGTDMAAAALPRSVHEIVLFLTPSFHLETFIKGLLDSRAILYFVSFVVFVLFMSVVVLEKNT